MKLRPKIFSLVIGILAVSIMATTMPLYWYNRSALEDEFDKSLQSNSKLIAQLIPKTLLRTLSSEPAMVSIREQLEMEMANVAIEEIDGMAIYTLQGQKLANWSRRQSVALPPSILLLAFADLSDSNIYAVTQLYQVADDEYIKAAVLILSPGDEATDHVLVIWGGADFVPQLDRLAGSLFWITLIAIAVTVSLALFFSESLLRPVMQLSGYAKAIQKNLYTREMRLNRDDEFGELNQSLIEMHVEIRENEQSMKDLLSGIAHEIKNPLGGIEIYTGLLDEALAEEVPTSQLSESREYLAKVTKELGHLKEIVMEYLDYARPMKSRFEPLELENVLDEVYRLLLPVFKKRNISYQSEGGGTIIGDQSKIQRVFLNMLENGLEALPDGGRLEIKMHNTDSTIKIDIDDDGKGIAESDLDSIFDPHFTTKAKGHGLGLSIVKNIVDELNGTIIVKSEVGKGTRFTLELPQADDDEK